MEMETLTVIDFPFKTLFELFFACIVKNCKPPYHKPL